MKNGSHRYDVNRTRPRNRHKYSKHKTFFSMIMVMCNRQRLSNIWSWIYEKVKQHWVLKKVLLIKKACTSGSKEKGNINKKLIKWEK